MTVLVTGASGLIGSHTVEALLERGEAVRTFQRTPPGHVVAEHPPAQLRAEHQSGQLGVERSPGKIGAERSPGQIEVEHPLGRLGVEHVVGDVRVDTGGLCAAAQGCRAVVHLAGRGDVGESRRDPVGYAALNATGALHALEAARAAGASFVLASSQRVYPLTPQPCREDADLAPDSPYGYAKWVAELWCRMASEQYGLTTTVLRFFSVYGPGQQANGGSGVVSIFAKAALAGEPLVVQSAGRRDFTHAADAARGIVLAVERASDGGHRVYNIATGCGTSFDELARQIVRTTRSRSVVEARVSETAGTDLVADISRARDELGYSPSIDLQTGLSRYVEWLRRSA